MTNLIIGVDVSKNWIDAFDKERGAERIETTPRALGVFARRAAKLGAFVVFEATGGYDAPLRAALEAAGVSFHRANPARARDFGRAMGVIGKTDRIDARLLAEMGARLDLPPTEPRRPSERLIQQLATRRRQLVEMRKQERTRLQQTADAALRAMIARHAKLLSNQIKRLEQMMAAATAKDSVLAERERLLRSAPGVGPIVATTLIAEMPELGALDRRRIASLAGLAPVACDSGQRSGQRRIRGGRPVARSALYLAAFVASRSNPQLREMRARLTAAGKGFKQTIVAVARKLLTILNAMLRAGRAYRAA